MKTPKLVLVALAALGMACTLAQAQDVPRTTPPPAVERPAPPPVPAAPPAAERPAPPRAAEAPTPPPAVEAPDVEAPDAAASDADEPRIVWDRDPDRERDFPPWRRDGGEDALVTIGGSSTLEAGRRAEAVVSIFGSSTSRGDVRDAVVSVMGNTRVEEGEVREAAVAVFGNNYVNAAVGEVVAVMGNVELGPKARVTGNVVVVGGTLTRDPAAIVRGGVQHILGFPPGAMNGLQTWARECLVLLRPLAFAPGLGWAWGIALGFLALYTLIGGVFREPVDRGVKTLREQPGQTVLASILALLLTPVVFTVIAFTFVLAPVIPLLGLGMFLATCLGKAIVLAWIGRSILRSFDDEERMNPAVPVLLGGAIVLLLYVVPILGFIVYNVFGILAFGVVVYMLLQSIKARRRNTPPRAGIGPKPAAPQGGGGAPAGSPTGTASDVSAAGATNAYGATPASGPEPSHGATGPAAAFTASGNPEGTAGSFGFTPGADPAFAGASSAYAADPSSAPQDSGSASGVGAGGNGGGSGGGSYGAGPAYAGGPPPGTGNVDALSSPRAGFWIRMLALLIDAIIIGGVFAFSIFDHSHKLQLIALATYGAIMWKLKGTTVGGIVCNLKVVRLDGREIDWSTAIVRALGCFLSLIILGLGFIWIAFDEGKQAWHDKIAGTGVVRVPQGISLL